MYVIVINSLNLATVLMVCNWNINNLGLLFSIKQQY